MKTPYEDIVRGAAATVVLALLTACGTSPLDSSGEAGATSTIRFALADRTTSAGIRVCDETDIASISVTPRGHATTSRQKPLIRGSDCAVEFTVTVPRGRVDFGGRLVGGGRTLMLGGEGGFRVERNGFVVRIPLREVDALGVETRTIGSGGPAAYEYSLEGSDLRFPIGVDDADTLAALAGGPRHVTLHAAPCVVVNGPAERDVMIPTSDARLGYTMFEIDCSLVGGTPGGGSDGGASDGGASDGGPSVDGGPPPPSPTKLDVIRVVTRIPRAPLPGEVTTFDATVTGASSHAQVLPIGVPDSVPFQVSKQDYPYAVGLTPTGSCTVKTVPSTQTVNRPASGGFTRVVFDIVC